MRKIGIFNARDCIAEYDKNFDTLKVNDYVVVSCVDKDKIVRGLKQNARNYNPRGRIEVRKVKEGDIYLYCGFDWILIEQEGKEKCS